MQQAVNAETDLQAALLRFDVNVGRADAEGFREHLQHEADDGRVIARIAGFQVDYSLFSGLAVDEQSTVYAVSGGTPPEDS